MNPEPNIESEVTQRNINITFQRHIRNLTKWYWKIPFIRQQWRNRHRDTFCGHGERGGEGEYGVWRVTWKLTLLYV